MSSAKTYPPQRERVVRAAVQTSSRTRHCARYLLLELLPSLGPVSAEGVQRALTERGLERALSSVYLTLSALERSGHVRSLRGAGRTTLFVRSGRAAVHLICRCCGCRKHLELPYTCVGALEAQSSAHGWRLLEPHPALSGLCRACRERGASNE